MITVIVGLGDHRVADGFEYAFTHNLLPRDWDDSSQATS